MKERLTHFKGIFGVFARTFPRATLDETLDCLRDHGIRLVQLNLASAGLPTLPDRLDDATCGRIAHALRQRDLTLAAVSGTFNMIHPDPSKRSEGLRRLDVLASSCRRLGTRLVTLCTGTRDPDDPWRSHPDNASPSAWADLVEAMEAAVAIAEARDVTLAFEPEVGNVVDSAARARLLLDRIGSPRLKVVLDPANLLRPRDLPRMGEVIDEAFDLLGPDLALVHAKEIAADGSVGEVTPGRGVLDFTHVFRRYLRDAHEVPVILHGLPESGVREGEGKLLMDFVSAATSDTFARDGVVFRYRDFGSGLPVAFQHGLGGDLTVPWGLFHAGPGVRLLSFDARYHGETRPLGDPDGLDFDVFADDLLALLDHLGVKKAVVGGISMGAGLALNFAIRHPDRTLGLVLSRPAWLDEPLPENVRVFPIMADYIRRKGAKGGLAAFRETAAYAAVLRESTDSASALVGMFEHPRAEETVEKLERIPRGCPSRDRSTWMSIRVPTLVLANRRDPIHPYAMGEDLAATIPGAELRGLTPKCESLEKHGADVQRHMTGFLERHFGPYFGP